MGSHDFMSFMTHNGILIIKDMQDVFWIKILKRLHFTQQSERPLSLVFQSSRNSAFELGYGFSFEVKWKVFFFIDLYKKYLGVDFNLNYFIINS